MRSTTMQRRAATPTRSLEQRRSALLTANRIRSERSVLKKRLKRGEVSPVEVLTHVPNYARTMHVIDFLMAVPSVGRTRATNALRRNDISPVKTLCGMTDRQRNALVRILS